MMNNCLVNPIHSNEVIADIRRLAGPDVSIVFVSGNFNVVHPGHLRVLNFAAECGDFLVVGVNADHASGVLLSADLRLQGIRAIGIVDYALLLDVAPEAFITALRPDVVVKGKEYAERPNPECVAVKNYGGELLFASGDARFSSLDLLQRELQENNRSSIYKPEDYVSRHRIQTSRLVDIVRCFRDLRVVVVGDLIVDEYISCDPLGMSQEDPTIVVTPIHHDFFIGGAAIVAAHAAGLGAEVNYFSIIGCDPVSHFARDKLIEHGVEGTLLEDHSRPTTLKQRYRAQGKTLLRVSHLRQHDISKELIDRLLAQISVRLEGADLLIFSDFNYGCLPQSLVDGLIKHCRTIGIPMVADSQSSSQIGDIARFKGMLLITPTEHEARLAVRDNTSGLTVLSDLLLEKAQANHVLVTLGAEGVLVHSPDNMHGALRTDQLPALNVAPKDISGAGDCMLTCAAMSMVAGASIWEAAYLGSIAAACQVGRVGNLPLMSDEMIKELLLL